MFKLLAAAVFCLGAGTAFGTIGGMLGFLLLLVFLGVRTLFGEICYGFRP